MNQRAPWKGFCERVTAARAEARAMAERAVRSKNAERWLSANEDDHEADWNQARKVKIEGAVAHTHAVIDLSTMSLEQLRARRAELLATAPEAIEVTTNEPPPNETL
jgi:hypothetical protein